MAEPITLLLLLSLAVRSWGDSANEQDYILQYPVSFNMSKTYRGNIAEKAFDGDLDTIAHTTGDEKHWITAKFKNSICPTVIIVINGKPSPYFTWLHNAEVYILESSTGGT